LSGNDNIHNENEAHYSILSNLTFLNAEIVCSVDKYQLIPS